MANELELIASVYVDEEGARTILDELQDEWQLANALRATGLRRDRPVSLVEAQLFRAR